MKYFANLPRLGFLVCGIFLLTMGFTKAQNAGQGETKNGLRSQSYTFNSEFTPAMASYWVRFQPAMEITNVKFDFANHKMNFDCAQSVPADKAEMLAANYLSVLRSRRMMESNFSDAEILEINRPDKWLPAAGKPQVQSELLGNSPSTR